jgi:hypothetical protein
MRALEELVNHIEYKLPKRAELLVEHNNGWYLWDREGNELEQIKIPDLRKCCWSHDGKSIKTLSFSDNVMTYGLRDDIEAGSDLLQGDMHSISEDLIILVRHSQDWSKGKYIWDVKQSRKIIDLPHTFNSIAHSGVVLKTETFSPGAIHFVLYDLIGRRILHEDQGLPRAISGNGQHIAYHQGKVGKVASCSSSIFGNKSWKETKSMNGAMMFSVSNNGTPLYCIGYGEESKLYYGNRELHRGGTINHEDCDISWDSRVCAASMRNPTRKLLIASTDKVRYREGSFRKIKWRPHYTPEMDR